MVARIENGKVRTSLHSDGVQRIFYFTIRYLHIADGS